MIHKLLILALSLIAIGCQTTKRSPHETLRDREPLHEKRMRSQADEAMIHDICSDSGQKALCHSTMATAMVQCERFETLRVDHARCILGSIQQQLEGSNVKYLLLGGRQ